MYMKEGTREKEEKVKPSPSPEEQLVGTLRDVVGLLWLPGRGGMPRKEGRGGGGWAAEGRRERNS